MASESNTTVPPRRRSKRNVPGVVMTVPLWLRRGGVGFWSRTHGTPPHPEASYALVRSRVPQVPRRPR